MFICLFLRADIFLKSAIRKSVQQEERLNCFVGGQPKPVSKIGCSQL